MIKSSAWKARGRFSEIEGYRLFYVEKGRGPVLLLLHAFPLGSWGWHLLFEALSRHYRVLAPDLPGFGFSSKPRGLHHYHFSRLTSLLENWLVEKGIAEIHLLANAFGTLPAQEMLARRYLDASPVSTSKIKSATFIGGGLFPEATSINLMQRFLLTPPGRALARRIPPYYPLFRRNFTRAFGADYQHDEWAARQVWELLHYNNGLPRTPELMRYLKDRKEAASRLSGALLQAGCPLYLINSQSDPVTGAALNQAWRKKLPGAPLHLLEGDIGHFPTLEAPWQVLDAFFACGNQHGGSS